MVISHQKDLMTPPPLGAENAKIRENSEKIRGPTTTLFSENFTFVAFFRPPSLPNLGALPPSLPSRSARPPSLVNLT